MKALTIVFILMVVIFSGYSNVHSTMIPLASGYSYQDEGTTSYDDTVKLKDLDGNWGPTVTGTVRYAYYATGTSDWYFDGISASFNLSPVGYRNITSATLWAYIKTGDYVDHNWHHYQLYNGAYSPTDQDSPPGAVPEIHSFDYNSYLVGGWISHEVPLAWITGDSVNVSLRLWNAPADQLKLEVTPVPVPPSAVLLVPGLVGLAGLRRRLGKQ